MLVTILLFILPVLLYVVYHVKKNSEYWEKKKVPNARPLPILGNFSELVLQKKFFGQIDQELCLKFPDAPYIGAFFGTKPILIVQDPEIIKLIMTKDFYFFSGREISEHIHKEKLGNNIFSTYGDRWKVLRQNMTPLFSSAKMKNMFYLIEKCSHVFEDMLDNIITNKEEIMNVRKLMARYTMDCVGSCAFGVETNTMENVDNNPFTKVGDSIFNPRVYNAFKSHIRSMWPAIFYALGFQTFPKGVDQFFSKLLGEIFEVRNYTPTGRNDFVDLMLKLKTNNYITGDSLSNVKSDSKTKVDLEVDDNLLISQCFILFAAGYETSATTLSHTLYELAKNPEVQERVLKEVDEYLSRNDNILKYECLTETPYIDACIDETLRLYPVLGVITREVIEDYKFTTGLTLEKGRVVHIPIYHLQRNPKYFPEPEQYRPERFLGAEKRNITPYTYMPFGDGPRVCIGMRFAKMQMTAGIITLLKKYRVELAPGMSRHLVFDPKSVVTSPVGGIRLNFIEREGWQNRLLKSP